MARAIDAIKTAYAAEFDRLAKLRGIEILDQCAKMARDLPPDTQLGDGLLSLARDGSIEAAAALNLLAVADQSLAPTAERAAYALFRRNVAACDEVITDELVRILEEVAEEEGWPFVIDPVTGEKRWTT